MESKREGEEPLPDTSFEEDGGVAWTLRPTKSSKVEKLSWKVEKLSLKVEKLSLKIRKLGRRKSSTKLLNRRRKSSIKVVEWKEEITHKMAPYLGLSVLLLTATKSSKIHR